MLLIKELLSYFTILGTCQFFYSVLICGASTNSCHCHDVGTVVLIPLATYMFTIGPFLVHLNKTKNTEFHTVVRLYLYLLS